MKKIIYILPLLLFFIIVGFFINGLNKDPRLIPSPLIGKAAPEFIIPQLIDEGKQLQQTDLKGKVLLLNFWATWCPTCRGEHDVLMEIARHKSVAMYGIDYKDKRPDAIKWLEDLGNPYHAIGFDYEGSVGIDWGVYGTPETFVIDKQGIIRYKHVGAISWQDWKQILEPIVLKLQQE